jgi:hypothetical protein
MVSRRFFLLCLLGIACVAQAYPEAIGDPAADGTDPELYEPKQPARDLLIDDGAQQAEEQDEDYSHELLGSDEVADSDEMPEEDFTDEMPDEMQTAAPETHAVDDEWTATSDLLAEEEQTDAQEEHGTQAAAAIKLMRKPKRFSMNVFVDAPGAHGLRVQKHKGGSEAARRLLKVRAGTWPDTGSSGYPNEAPREGEARVGPDRDFNDVRGGAAFEYDVTAVTFRIPHDGDPTTNSQILTLHGRATDPDAWVDTQEHPNDPYTPHFHDPYSGSAGTDTLDGPRAGAQNEHTDPDHTLVTPTFSGTGGAQAGRPIEQGLGSGTTAGANPRGRHDPLKLDWQCDATAMNQKAPAVAPFDSVAHAQGYRKSTGQRTQGNDQFFGDERTSCSSVPDVTGFKPACLVHSYDQPPATKWGSHALQDGPAITITVNGPAQNWPLNSGAESTTHVCTLKATDPYGATDTMTVTITVEKEENVTPTSTWKAGGVTTYTVPHDHSPETHHVQVLLDGEYDDADNHNDNIGPLGNTATETTAMGTAEQLKWQFVDKSKTTDGFDGIFYGNAPAKKYVGTGYCADGTYGSRLYADSRADHLGQLGADTQGTSLKLCQDACSNWPECHTLYFEADLSQCTLYSSCQNNDATKITAGTGVRYTKEVDLGTSWAMFRGRPDEAYHENDHMQGHGFDKVTFLWTCPTAGGFFFEETLGACMSGDSAAAAFEGTDYGGYCENTAIEGRPEDVCEHACLRTSGCTGFEVFDVEYLGVCTTSDTCTANKCKLMFLDGAAPTCPTGWTANAGSTTVADHHGNGIRKTSRCYTKKNGQAFDVLKPVVSLPGPTWALATAWQDPGGQKGDTAGASGQWTSESVNHVCTLRVTDSYGATVTHDTTITINREPNTLPVAAAGDATRHASADAATQTYTVPHDFYPSDETNLVLVTLYGALTADADSDQMKHVWECVCDSGACGSGATAWATIELPFPVQLGGINTGFTQHWEGGIQTGAGDPDYVESLSTVQMSTGWGADLGHSGDGDTFVGTHSHQAAEVTVMLGPGVHTCTLTTTDTYNEASTSSVVVTISAEPNTNPDSS